MRDKSNKVVDEYSYQLLVTDIFTMYPTFPAEEIIDLIQRTILEVMPDAILKVRVSKNILSPFDIKSRGYLDQRRRKPTKDRERYSVETDPEMIVRSAKALFHPRYDIGNGGYALNENFESAYTLPDRSYGHYLVSDTIGTQTVNLINRESTQIHTFGKSGTRHIPVKKSIGTKRKTSYEMESELLEVRDTSMAIRRFFSILEIEAREFANTIKEDLKFHLMRTDSRNPNLVLSVGAIDDISAIDLSIYSQLLEEKIRKKLSITLPKLAEVENDDFIAAINNFTIKPLFTKSPSSEEVETILSSMNARVGRNLDFEDIRKICDVEKAESNYGIFMVFWSSMD